MNSCKKSSLNCSEIKLQNEIGQLLNQFYGKGDTSLLFNVLKKIDSCGMQEKYYPTKLQVFVLLNDYQSALNLVNSLSVDQFYYSYQKEMFSHFYQIFMSTDSLESEKLILKLKEHSELILDSYLNEQEPMLDYLAIMNLVTTKEIVLARLDSLETEFTDDEFFKILRNTAEDWPSYKNVFWNQNKMTTDTFQIRGDTLARLPF